MKNSNIINNNNHDKGTTDQNNQTSQSSQSNKSSQSSQSNKTSQSSQSNKTSQSSQSNQRQKTKRQAAYNNRPQATTPRRQHYATNIGYSSASSGGNRPTDQRNDNINNSSSNQSWTKPQRQGTNQYGGGDGQQQQRYSGNTQNQHGSSQFSQSNTPSWRKNAKKKTQGGKYQSNYFSITNSYDYELISVKRIVKVVKGGRRFRFSVVVVIGDYKTKIGYGVGKAGEIPIAILKARSNAIKKMISVNINPLTQSIWFNVSAKYNASKIILKNARPGTGIVAGGSTRQLLSFSGIKNIYAKAHGSRRKLNMIRATIKALEKNYIKGWIRQDYQKDIN